MADASASYVHGTLAAANAHNRALEVLCDPCRQAASEYVRWHRYAQKLGLPVRTHGGGKAAQIRNDGPSWRRKADLVDLAIVGPVLDAAWRWNA